MISATIPKWSHRLRDSVHVPSPTTKFKLGNVQNLLDLYARSSIPEYRRQSSIHRICEAYTILADIDFKFLSTLGSLLQFVMAVPLSLLVFSRDVTGQKMNSSITGSSDNIG